MAYQVSQQYAFRAQKSLGLVHGPPDYNAVTDFHSPDVPARTFSYSADGRLLAYALPTVVRIFQAEGAQLLQELSIPNALDLRFSPRGTYLSTWERPLKLEDGSQHKNLRVFSTSTGEELVSFSQKTQEGWDLQYTISESHALRLVSSEIQVYRPADWSKGIVEKLKVDGATSVSLSPGLNPSVAVFVAGKKGGPASIKIYGLLTLNAPPTCQKSTFKADRTQMKWNTLGTQVLVLTQTEVDNTNKNYYGETGMYLLSAVGNFDCRIPLDRDGPIHDFAWNPNSKEFGVVYGYMPAKAMLFDQRVRTIHDFGAAPVNTISFNPQGRLVLLAGFGNLAGKTDIYDRRTLNKVCSLDAPGTAHLEWSPDGRFLMTAILSPRLRVDNGLKVWHCTGSLIHVQLCEELYQVAWRPATLDNVPTFPPTIPQAPPASESVQKIALEKPAVVAKPAGAYRPPAARGTATPTLFKREDEGGVARTPGSGAATPPRAYNRPPPGAAGGFTNGYHNNGGSYHHPQNGGRRHVPGAASPQQAQHPHDGDKKKKKKVKKENGKEGVEDKAKVNGGLSGDVSPSMLQAVQGEVDRLTEVSAVQAAESSLDPTAKKIRNLNKKLKAIEELKEKVKRGERLEATQLKKMEGEVEIRKELVGLSEKLAA